MWQAEADTELTLFALPATAVEQLAVKPANSCFKTVLHLLFRGSYPINTPFISIKKIFSFISSRIFTSSFTIQSDETTCQEFSSSSSSSRVSHSSGSHSNPSSETELTDSSSSNSESSESHETSTSNSCCDKTGCEYQPHQQLRWMSFEYS